MHSKKREIQKTGLTLIEVLVTVIIVGILASIAIPMFPRAMESAKSKEAVAALRQIRTAERVYRVEENTYWPLGSTESDIYEINENLRVFLDTRDDRNWDYSVTATANTFQATATRRGGGTTYKGGKIKIDQDGNLTRDGWPLPLPGQ